MTDTSLLKKYIDDDLLSYAVNFDIPEEFLETDSILIILILKSKALETDEDKQNWLNLLPLMTEEQIYKLKEILLKEKDKLEEIEDKYKEKKRDIRQKYLLRWQKLGYVEKVKELKEKEEQMKTKEEQEAEDLLNSL
jgi:hypothetical protein